MEKNPQGGDNLHPTPEEREQLRINSIVIPADEEEPLRQHELVPSRLADYQQLVGGMIEVVTLDRPPASMYVNEEGKLLGLPVNRRATMLLWAHNPAFRYQDVIAGDAFLTGEPDQEGVTTQVSEHYVNLLCEARSFRVELQMQGEEEWSECRTRFDTWAEAYEFAFSLDRTGPHVADFRVVPEP